MTRLFVSGQIDWWNAFWIFSTWAAAYMIAAVYLREKFGAPQTLFEKYWLWFGRVVGVVGASIIFAYGYRATGELERVEHECERYKALAAQRANGVKGTLLSREDYRTVSFRTENGNEVAIRIPAHDDTSRSMLGTEKCEAIDNHTDWSIDGSSGRDCRSDCSIERPVGRTGCNSSSVFAGTLSADGEQPF